MEITGKIIKLLDVQSFTSKKQGHEGEVFNKYAFVLETQGQYPKHVMFTVMGDERFKALGIVLDGTYNVSFDIDAREWQGRWFNELSAWKAVRTDVVGSSDGNQSTQQQQAVATTKPEPSSTQAQVNTKSDAADDLPF